MADEGTFSYTVAGRDMVFKNMTLSRISLLQRLVDKLQVQIRTASTDEDARVFSAKLYNLIWTTVESQFTSQDDLDTAQTAILTGNIDEDDLLPLLSNGKKRPDPQPDDADPPVKKRAPARKTAARSRAKK